ncbi:hypothetical protein ACHAXS_006741 [Conticribra weissflogii]
MTANNPKHNDATFSSDHIILKDGRQLHYTQHGPATGTPIIHCHGSGGSRLEHPVDTSILTSLNVRFLSVDRPGHGLSSPSPHRTLSSFSDEVDQLNDRLKISKFYVEGWGMERRWILRSGHCPGVAP